MPTPSRQAQSPGATDLDFSIISNSCFVSTRQSRHTCQNMQKSPILTTFDDDLPSLYFTNKMNQTHYHQLNNECGGRFQREIAI